MFEPLIFSLFGFMSDEQIFHARRFDCSLTLGVFTAENRVCR